MSINKDSMDPAEWKKTIKFLENLPPPVIERREACYHETIKKVMRDDFLYYCDNCGQIIEIVGSALYWPETYLKKIAAVTDHILKTNPDVKDVQGK